MAAMMKCHGLFPKTLTRPCYRLHEWEEAVGPLKGIRVENGFLVADIGKITLILPVELEELLGPLLECTIGLLRTNIPSREYLVRVISEPSADVEHTVLTRDDSMQISEEV